LSSGRQIPFKTSYLSDPWNLPNPDDKRSTSMVDPLSTTEVTYKDIQETTVETESQTLEPEESDMHSTSIWAIGLSTRTNSLDSIFPSDEAIMEVMNMTEKP
jgi:hypothetical protein